jgi:enterochelin esterase-like enzyme
MNDALVPQIMDNLIAEGKTEPAVVVTMDNNRYFKYQHNLGVNADSTDYRPILRNIMEILLPAIERRYNISSDPSGRAFGGESMGGMTSSQVYYNYTTQFGYYGIWSGAYMKDADWHITYAGTFVDYGKPLVMSSAGMWDPNRYSQDSVGNSTRSNQAFEARMNEYGLPYFGPANVPGAHSMETWHQIFPIFVTDYLWR